MYICNLEKKYISCGNDSPVFETRLGISGGISGYDLFYLETCRVLYKKKVEIIICTALLPIEYQYASQHLAISRCILIFFFSIGNWNKSICWKGAKF